MAKTANINVRIDPETKAGAEEFFARWPLLAIQNNLFPPCRAYIGPCLFSASLKNYGIPHTFSWVDKVDNVKKLVPNELAFSVSMPYTYAAW